ncbi:MAG TPA: hypothetical protein VKR82_16105 [Candidatus Acidoferrales bacterium]|nr:hypothetical protein [Candidatus Acidoferrales bacterium]
MPEKKDKQELIVPLLRQVEVGIANGNSHAPPSPILVETMAGG